MNNSLRRYLDSLRIENIGDIKWAHAVNDIKYLEKALHDPNVDFIESDVSVSRGGEPIAAHYSNTSDLKVEKLIKTVKHFNKVLKLDFKAHDALYPSLKLLNSADITNPVILNADIMKLKNAPAPIITPQDFISNSQKYYPEGLLSLGWRTTDSSTYEDEDIDKMLSICSDLKEVTFPLRASLLDKSWKEIKKLIEKENFTLTIWNSEPLSQRLKAWINQNTDAQKCFYDFET
jgi:hypothetical protein